MKIITILLLIIILLGGSITAYCLCKPPLSGTTEEYFTDPSTFQMSINGETAIISDNQKKLSTASKSFIVPIKGDYKRTGTVKINVKTNDHGIAENHIGIGTGDYAKPDTKWTLNKGWFTWTSRERFIFGHGYGTHILCGDTEMKKALNSLRIGDEVEITGLEGVGIMEVTIDGQTFTANTVGCDRVIITGLKIKRG